MKSKLIAYSAIALLLGAAGNSNAAVISWVNTGGATAWYTAANWSPSTAAAAWTTADVAQFNNTGTATTAGINMGTSALSIGAIEVTSSRSRGLTIGNSSGTSGNLTLNGATFNSVSNVVLRNASTSALTIQNNETGSGKTMNVVLANTTNNVVLVEGTGNIVISSNISGASRILSVNASSSGDLRLSGTNSWSGGTNITGGTAGGRLRVDAVAALPTTGTVAVSTGGRLTLNVAGTYGGTTQALTFNPDQTANPSLDTLSGAAVIWQGTVAINADTRIEPSGATGSLTFSGNASGSGTLIKQAAGNLILSGTANTLTGGTQVGNGTLTVNSGSKLGTGALSFAQTSTNNTAVVMNQATQSIGGLSSTWSATTGTQTQTLTLNGTALTVNQSTDATFGKGAVSTLTSSIGGTGSLTKSGSAALTLDGTNTYSGSTVVSAGSLFVNGSLSNTSGTTVSDTATLGGTGSIANGVSVASGGTLAVGINDSDTSIGTLTLGSLALSGLLEMGATGALSYDKLITAGAFSVSGGTIAFRTSSYTIAHNTSFDLANFTGSATGATFDFSGAAVQPYGAWDTSAFASTGVISYVPEPRAALLGGIGVLLLLRRRR